MERKYGTYDKKDFIYFHTQSQEILKRFGIEVNGNSTDTLYVTADFDIDHKDVDKAIQELEHATGLKCKIKHDNWEVDSYNDKYIINQIKLVKKRLS